MIDVKLLYPIGSIYMSIQDTNPSVFFGGTWERIAKGKALVGVDENDTDFNASSKIGGEKEHTLTKQELPKIDIKTYYATTSGGNGSGLVFGTSTGHSNNKLIENVNYENRPHNNMQPYYTCYIFVRTA